MLVKAFQLFLRQPTHCAGVTTGQDSPSKCETGAWWSSHSHRDQESHNAAKVDKSPGTDRIPAEVYHYRVSLIVPNEFEDLFTSCWTSGSVYQLMGERDSATGPQGCNHCLSLQTQGRKVRLPKLPQHHPTLHCRQNPGSHLAAQIHLHNSTGKHSTKPMWVQVQQRDHRHDIHAEENIGEKKAENRTWFCVQPP